MLVVIGLITTKFINSKDLLETKDPNDNGKTNININDSIIDTNEQKYQVEDSIESSKNDNILDNNDPTPNDTISNSKNNFTKQISVKDGNLYDNNSNELFQIIGINFDNNTWNLDITAINTGHDETSYNELAAIGFNTIRFGLAYNMTLQDNFFEWLDTNIKQAEKAGLKIILDMHASQDGIQIRDKDATYRFWHSEQLQQEFIDTWVMIAKHYSQSNTVIMYDLLNEPLVIIDENQNADDIYYNFISKLVESIRKVDKKTVICIEGYSSSILKYDEQINETNYVANTTESASVIQKINDDNIVFDVHSYSPTEYTFQTEESPIAYSDLYTVKDKKSWIENTMSLT